MFFSCSTNHQENSSQDSWTKQQTKTIKEEISINLNYNKNMSKIWLEWWMTIFELGTVDEVQKFFDDIKDNVDLWEDIICKT